MSCSVLEKLNELNLTSDFVESNIQLKEQARSVVCVKVGNFLLPLGPCHAGRLAVLFSSICVRYYKRGMSIMALLTHLRKVNGGEQLLWFTVRCWDSASVPGWCLWKWG